LSDESQKKAHTQAKEEMEEVEESIEETYESDEDEFIEEMYESEDAVTAVEEQSNMLNLDMPVMDLGK